MLKLLSLSQFGPDWVVVIPYLIGVIVIFIALRFAVVWLRQRIAALVFVSMLGGGFATHQSFAFLKSEFGVGSPSERIHSLITGSSTLQIYDGLIFLVWAMFSAIVAYLLILLASKHQRAREKPPFWRRFWQWLIRLWQWLVASCKRKWRALKRKLVQYWLSHKLRKFGRKFWRQLRQKIRERFPPPA